VKLSNNIPEFQADLFHHCTVNCNLCCVSVGTGRDRGRATQNVVEMVCKHTERLKVELELELGKEGDG
jgi:hypothetical protein